MNYFKRNFLSLTSGERLGMGMLLVLAVILGVFGIATFDDLLAADTIREYIGGIIPLLSAAVAIIGLILIWFHLPTAAAFLTIGAMSASMVAIPMVAVGYILPAMSITLLIPTSLAILLLKGRNQSTAFLMAIVGSLSIILIDSYWPFQRIGIGLEDIRLANSLSIILFALYFVLVVSQFRNLSLQLKLVMAFLLTTAIPVILLGWLTNTSTTRYLEEQGETSLLTSAEQLSDTLDTLIASNLDSVRLAASDPGIKEFLELAPEQRADMEASLDAVGALESLRTRDQINILSVALLDRSGTNILDTLGEDIGHDESNETYFSYAVVNQYPYASPLALHENESTSSITFSAPVRDELGNVIGVLRLRLQSGIIQQQLLNTRALKQEGTFAMVVDQNYLVLANSNNPFALNKAISSIFDQRLAELKSVRAVPDVSSDELESKIPDLERGLSNFIFSPTFTGEFQSDDIRQGVSHQEKAAAARLENMNWYVVVFKSQDVLLAPAQQQTQSLVLIGSIITGAAMLLAMIIAQLIATPVLRLSRVAEQVAAGDLAARAEITTQDEIGTLANTFNTMTSQLNNMIDSLEQRVADRTKALATSADVSRRLSTILDPAELVKEVVDQLQQAFDYYHVHIYLVDENTRELVMAGGTGEAGKMMLARGHRLAPGLGLVGRAAATAVPVLVSNVSQAPGWVANPLLPDTRSELAVPLTFSGQVVGVLDVQQNRVDGLSQTDADLLQAIAAQVAIGLNNARAYAQTQQRADREALVTAINQRISRTTSAEDALKVAVRELGRALNAPKVSVKLGQPDGENNRN